MTPEIEQAKAKILKTRRQRIRKTTYPYVAGKIIEDTKIDNPFRDKMVVDWWARVVDPLEAENYNRKRLQYFRDQLKEHRNALRINAAIRQGVQEGKRQRRLKSDRLAYVELQIKRLSDPKLNYAASQRALEISDNAYEQLTIGLFALPHLAPKRADSFLIPASVVATRDERFPGLYEKVQLKRSSFLPGVGEASFERRTAMLTDPNHEDWYVPNDDWADYLKDGFIRKLEDKYLK
ncbi:hypothetical protein LP7551_03942 [Roseibium album]|nr:hypothetical protein LP7551_03942 [Roseibium album]